MSGFIARRVELGGAALELAESRVIPLAREYAFLPLTDEIASKDEQAPFNHLLLLTERLGRWAHEASAIFPLAYIETDYFGGVGSQSAIVWRGGSIALGPVRTTTLRKDERFVSTPLREGAINRALRLIGVARGSALDEFDALGLWRYRDNESWLTCPFT